MSSEEALGILKNWSTARTSVLLNSIIGDGGRIRWLNRPITVVRVEGTTVTLRDRNSGEEDTLLLADAKFGQISSVEGFTVKTEDGDQFSLEAEPNRERV
jgi:hypothetical protein